MHHEGHDERGSEPKPQMDPPAPRSPGGVSPCVPICDDPAGRSKHRASRSATGTCRLPCDTVLCHSMAIRLPEYLHRARTWLSQPAFASRRHSIDENMRTWSRWDWSTLGDEWTPSPEWKESLLGSVLRPHVPNGARVLEIGPGAGRWSEHLLERASQFVAVDVTAECIEVCNKRFARRPDASFILNDGRDLSFVASEAIDRIWSFDVFVHICSADAARYIRQFPRILSPGGCGLIHHSRSGVEPSAWRSDLTAARMRHLCATSGLEVVRQFSTWQDGRFSLHGGGKGSDVITIFRKPEVHDADGSGT
jgi:SAM-dependent methyltransferase